MKENHNDAMWKELGENGIEPHSPGGGPLDVSGGYPPKIHDCMPCEMIIDHTKKNARRAFKRLKTVGPI